MKTAFALLLLLPLAGSAQTGTVSGRVTGAPGGEVLPGVNVTVHATARGTTTDARGKFLLRGIPPGTYTVAFSLVGYARAVVPGVAVTAGGDTTLDVVMDPLPIPVDLVVVTASRREQSLQDVPVSVSSVDASWLGVRNFQTIDDALRYVPGVNLTEYQVNIRGSSGYSRGAGSRVLLLVDGIPFLTGDTGELNFETIPLGQVDRIEVVKGASSALYGSGALGGVVNVLTRPIPEQPLTRIRLQGGLYGAPSYAVWDWGGGTRLFDGQAVTQSFRNGGTGVMMYASRFADDGYKQNDFRRRYNLFAKGTLDLGLYDELSLSGNLMHQKRGSFLYWKDLSRALVPPDAQQGDRVRSTRFFLSGHYRRAVSAGLLLTARVLWFRNLWNDTIDTLSNDSRSDVIRGEVQGTWALLPGSFTTFGVEGNLEGVRADLFGTRRGGGGAAYVQHELEPLDGLKATLGIRYDFQDRDSLAAEGRLSPKAGLVFVPAAGTAIRASYGGGFRVPSVAEAFITAQAGGLDIIPNPSLRSERSTSAEVGVSQFIGGMALVDAAVFQSDFRDLIEPRFVSVGGELKGQFNNVTRARVQGAELSLKTGFLERSLLVDAGYTVVYPRDLGLNDLLKYRPRRILTASVSFRRGGWLAGADVRLLSRVDRIDEDFTTIVRDGGERVAISVIDLRAGVDIPLEAAAVTAVLAVNNVLQYNAVDWIGNLLPPRTFVLTLETVF